MGNAITTTNECFDFLFPPCIVVTIKTGDTTSAGLHNAVTIQLTDEFGREADDILEGCSLTVFKKGHTDAFRITKVPENFGTVKKVRLSRNETKRNVVEWYVERVEIRYHKLDGPDEALVFPCNRWIRNGKPVVLQRYDSSLPQCDEEAAQRDAELFSKRAKYRYCQGISGLPPRLKKFPKNEVFSNNYKWDISLRKDKLFARHNLIHFEKTPWKDFHEFDVVYRTLGEPMLTEVTPGICLYENLITDSWVDVTSVNFNERTSKHFWMDDAYFGRQRVAGCNPTVLRLCKEIPPGFRVTSSLVHPFIEGMRLEEAMEASRLFIVDYSILEKADVDSERVVISPYGLFFLNKNRDLIPVAIQLFAHQKENNPVFVPTDPIYTWALAKMWFNNADAGYHRACAHLGLSHILLESIAIATHRQLSPSHPVYRLLASYIHYVIPINSFETNLLVAYDGWLDNGTNLGVSGIISIFQEIWPSWRLDLQGYLPKDLEDRGVLDPEILPEYPYRDDGLLIHNAIENHVRRVVEQNYCDEKNLLEDFEVQAWANDLTEEDPLLGCNIKGVPGGGKFRSFDELIQTLTSIIFMCTAGHAAVNLPQYDEYGYPPNYPALLLGEPPCNTRWRDKHDLLKHLPTKDLCMQSVIFSKLLTDRKTNGLADFNAKFQYDPIAENSREQFLRDLRKTAISVMERNLLRKYPYDYLNPGSSKN